MCRMTWKSRLLLEVRESAQRYVSPVSTVCKSAVAVYESVAGMCESGFSGMYVASEVCGSVGLEVWLVVALDARNQKLTSSNRLVAGGLLGCYAVWDGLYDRGGIGVDKERDSEAILYR